MKIKLNRSSPPYEMEATNEAGWKVQIDAGVAGGGKGNGVRPMELLVMGLGGCSGIDIISILDKQRQTVTRFDVELDAERVDAVPAIFSRIHAHYVFEGTVDAIRARRAIDLSLDKYCSVSRILSESATITYSFSVNGERHE